MRSHVGQKHYDSLAIQISNVAVRSRVGPLLEADRAALAAARPARAPPAALRESAHPAGPHRGYAESEGLRATAGPDLATAWGAGVGLSRSADATATEGEAEAASAPAPHGSDAACGSGGAACGSAAAAEGAAPEGAAPGAGEGGNAGQGGACGAAAAGAAAGEAGTAADAAAASTPVPQSSREGTEWGARREAAPEAATTRKAKRARGAAGAAARPQVALPSEYRGRCVPKKAGWLLRDPPKGDHAGRAGCPLPDSRCSCCRSVPHGCRLARWPVFSPTLP